VFLKFDKLALIFILLIAAALRFWGIDFGLPGRFRPDEEFLVNAAIGIARGELDPNFYIYPSFSFYILAIVFRLQMFIEYLLGFSSGDDIFNNISKAHLIGRYVSAFFGVSSILLIYRLGSKIKGYDLGLMSALMLALSYGHVRDSHFCTTDIIMTFFLILAFDSAYSILQTNKIINYVKFGIYSGLSFSVKYPAISVLSLLFMSHFLREFRSKNRTKINSQFLSLIITGCIFILVFFITSPFVVISWQEVLRDYEYQIWFIEKGILGDKGVYGLDWILGFSLPLLMGAPLFFAFLISLVFFPVRFFYLKKSKTEFEFVLIFFALALCAAFIKSRWVFVRYLIPLTPVSAILVSSMVLKIIDKFSFKSTFSFSLLFAIALMFDPLSRIVRTNMLLSGQDTRNMAKEWIDENVNKGQTIAWSGHFFYPKPDKTIGVKYVDFNSSKDFENLVNQNEDFWIVIDKHLISFFSPDPPKEVVNLIKERAKLIVSFNPYPGAKQIKPVFEPNDAFYVPLTNFENVTMAGPELEIYFVTRMKIQ
jgi:hypothetical protein